MKIFMRTLPLKTSLVVAGITMATSLVQAEGFDLSEKLSVTGFIDMSTYYQEVDKELGTDESTAASGLDQFELDFLFAFDEKLKAQVDIEYQEVVVGEEVDLEQAFFTYSISEQVSVKAGRFLSYSGWETEEPTGLFQYSPAGYAVHFYGGYQQGTSVMYTADSFDVAVSLVNDLGDLEGTATDSKKPGIETMLAFRPVEGATVKAFYLSDDEDEKINVWGSYGTDKYTVALEYNMADFPDSTDTEDKSEASGYLAMANYVVSDKVGVTLRYHAWEVEDQTGETSEDVSGITLAPTYKVTPNLLLIAEYRTETEDVGSTDTDTVALEALLSF